MALSIADAQARVLALNSDDLPFIYTPSPDGIVAYWKYADQRWLGIAGAGLLTADYELTVTLDADEGTWEFHEKNSSAEAHASASGIGASKSWGSGKQKSFSFNASAAPIAKTRDRQGEHTGQLFGYSFTTDEVKQPLVDALTAAGWKAKKGFFGKLFGG